MNTNRIGYLFALALMTLVFTRPAMGQGWTATGAPYDRWYAIACSADGSCIFAQSPQTSVSTNSGSTWRTAVTTY